MKKRLTEGYAQFPNSRILDGTLSRMSVAEIRIYSCMSMWVNWRTGEGSISNKAIARYCNITSGSRIQEAIHNLEQRHKMVKTWTVPKLNWNDEESELTVRHYRIMEANPKGNIYR